LIANLKVQRKAYDPVITQELGGVTRSERSATCLRVLLSVYACEPGKGSEQGVGWNAVRQIARFHEVWALTRANNRQSIEHALVEESIPNVHWVYFDLPKWARFWKNGQRGGRLYYYLWQIGIYFKARNLHQRVDFNLAHHLTFVKYWVPSFIALLPIPFVWGPVGGAESAPLSFWYFFSLRGKVHEFLRHTARRLAEIDPFVRLTARRAAFAFSTTKETKARLQALGCQRVSVLSAVGLPADEICRLGSLPVRLNNTFRLMSIGNLLHLKGFELGLRAFARFSNRFPDSEYWLVGDGPERKPLERLARKLGVAGKVTFCGPMPRSRVLEKLAECDVLLHPSLHDSGGWVCLEAMAARRPVVCLDLGGPGLQVTAKTGIKVTAITPRQCVADLAAAITRLAEDSTLRVRLGQEARQWTVENYDWDKKGEFLMKAYANIVSSAKVQS
jgi:glycosyltransferase involved in cell wall biosynthesis